MSKPKKSSVVPEELKVARMPKPRRKRKRYQGNQLSLFPGSFPVPSDLEERLSSFFDFKI